MNLKGFSELGSCRAAASISTLEVCAVHEHIVPTGSGDSASLISCCTASGSTSLCLAYSMTCNKTLLCLSARPQTQARSRGQELLQLLTGTPFVSITSGSPATCGDSQQ